MKALNLIGEKYGKLTVLSKAENIGKRTAWLCECECYDENNKHRTIVTTTDRLRRGQTKSCGKCGYMQQIAHNTHFQDLTNKTFGFLTVINRTENLIQGNQQKTAWLCKCQCGNTCIVTAENLKTGNTMSCGCKKFSKGEKKIYELLTSANIPFIQQYKNSNCKDIKELPFDFFVDNTYIIEFDGEQHFEYKENKGWNNIENFNKTQEHDKIKNQWCFDNNIPIIRIPYTHLNKRCLEDVLLETSSFIVRKPVEVTSD